MTDGTEIIIHRPNDETLQRFYYSAKKKQHSINVLFVVLLDGRIIYKSKAYTGNVSDQGAWNYEKLRDRFIGLLLGMLLVQCYLLVVSGKLYGVGGDSGFTFNRLSDWEKIKAFQAHSNKNNNTVTVEQEEENTNLARIRAVVENVFAVMKQWACISGMFRHM